METIQTSYWQTASGRRLWVTQDKDAPSGRVRVWDRTYTSNPNQPSHKWVQIARPSNIVLYVERKLASGEWSETEV